MQVRISDQAAADLERLVKQGHYGDASEAVETAIRLLTQSDAGYVDEVQAKVLASVESLDKGRGTLLTREVAEKVNREGRARLERRRQAGG